MPRWLATIGLSVALVGVGTAHAEAPSEADTLFAQGRDLLEKGRFAEACAKLQKSEELAPAVGTLLNLGYCWEQLGRMRSAMESYSEAQIVAHNAGDTKRYAFAKERFDAVAPKAVKLVIRVAEPKTEGLEVRRNGTLVPKTDWEQPIPVDPDDFVVTASAPGRTAFRGNVAVRGEGNVVTFAVPALAPGKDDGRTSGSAGGGTHLTSTRLAALGLGAVAAATIGAGIGVGLSAKARYDDSSYHCDASGCDAIGAAVQSDARSEGNVATALVGLGVLSAAAGVYLWIVGGDEHVAPKKAAVTGAPPVSPATGFDGRAMGDHASTANHRGIRVELRPLGAAIGARF